MEPRKGKSWKPSSGMSDLQHKPTLFIDRNSGGRLFKALIVASGIHVVLHDEVDLTP
jgi:hypothetical protein